MKLLKDCDEPIYQYINFGVTDNQWRNEAQYPVAGKINQNTLCKKLLDNFST